ncbi:HAD family hydrolase [Angustibacter peucedani]
MPAALVDVDGTLVDTNYLHVLAWTRSFAEHDLHPPTWLVHRHIGMGGDQLVAAVTDQDVERRLGDSLRDGWKAQFDPLLDEVRLLPGAVELLKALRDKGWTVVLASSGKPEHTEKALDLLGDRGLVDGWTTSEDVDTSKPSPELLQVALDQVDERTGVVVGDSVWDVESARRCDLPSVGLRTGGFGVAELREAGAHEVHDDLVTLRAALDSSLLGDPEALQRNG